MITLLTILLVLVIVYPLVRYTGFFLSNWRSGQLAEIRRRQGGMFRPILRGVGTAMMADAAMLPAYAFGWFCRFGREGKGTPIIMVHGLFHNASAWYVMLHRLGKAGFSNLHTYQYDSFFNGFDTAVRGLERKLDQVLGSRPGTEVILIGHSLGGLVCRAVAGDQRYSSRIKAMVALGSPHHGSDLARLGANRMSRGLIPGHSIPQTVAEVPDPPCPRLAIYTLVDDFVYPLRALQPGRDGWEEQICSPMAHVWMLVSREIFRRVVTFLRQVDDGEDKAGQGAA